MSDLRELYQEVILDHGRRPRNFRALETPCQSAEGYNPLCGDQLKLYVKLEGDRIADIAFEGAGCAISTASASLMTTTLKGKSTAEAEQLFEQFHDMVTRGPGQAREAVEGLGKLAVLGGVCEFPVRVKCASLAWHTLKSALTDGAGVKTE